MPHASREITAHERITLRTFVQASTSKDERALLDDLTWDDLDMDAVAARIDRSVSLPGRMMLRLLLRTPTTCGTVATERERLVGVFEKDPGLDQALRADLGRLDQTVGLNQLVAVLWDTPPTPLRYAWTYPLLALLGLLSLIAAFTIGKILIFAPMLTFSLNAALHFRTRFRWQAELQSFRFIGRWLAVANRVAALKANGIEGHQQRLAAAVRQATPLTRQIAWLSSGAVLDILYEYANVFFLLELQAYQRILVRLPHLVPALREAFLTLGELDALAGVARWRSEQRVWCRPELHDGLSGLVIEDGTHPLLDPAVPNSIALSSRGALVTGANMSGKSTFLRVLGINAILAQTIGTCTARRYRAARFRVLSSMRVADDLVQGKSRYLAEAERLLTLVRQVGSPPPALCLIDELLSGTNAVERLAASAAILEHLAHAGALVVAATHDLELAHHIHSAYDNYYFADDFSADDVRFDHHIRAGLATTRNAIQLLERLGYPRELVDRARGVLHRQAEIADRE